MSENKKRSLLIFLFDDLWAKFAVAKRRKKIMFKVSENKKRSLLIFLFDDLWAKFAVAKRRKKIMFKV